MEVDKLAEQSKSTLEGLLQSHTLITDTDFRCTNVSEKLLKSLHTSDSGVDRYNLGWLYQNGLGVDVNYTMAKNLSLRRPRTIYCP